MTTTLRGELEAVRTLRQMVRRPPFVDPVRLLRYCGSVAEIDLLRLRDALEASWDSETSYARVVKLGNPAYGQCYPTARVVQHFFPETEIAEGQVWTGQGVETHFWNVLDHAGTLFHIDLTWQQFPAGSSVRAFTIWDRSTLGDGEETVRRVDLLLSRVKARLIRGGRSCRDADQGAGAVPIQHQ